jgi:hypothetical protein
MLIVSTTCCSTLVACLLLFVLRVVSTCVLICLVLLMDGFSSLIFIYRVFLLTCGIIDEAQNEKITNDNSHCHLLFTSSSMFLTQGRKVGC